MEKLKMFLVMMTGNFDNRAQYEKFKEEGKEDFPMAEHVNTLCNDKIINLPEDFKGEFLLEESYYTTKGNTKPMPHLFLFSEKDGAVVLESYEMPEGYDNDSFKYGNLTTLDFNKLKKSEKFNPIVYIEEPGVFIGKSESMFSPVLKFTIREIVSDTMLSVSETFEVNGRRTFGFDVPIEYIRK